MKSYNEIIYDQAYQYENPLSAMIELTCKCNWKCEHCYVEHSHNDVYTLFNLKKILKVLKLNGIHEIVYIGGEIFTRKDIMDIIQLTRELYFDVILESNVSIMNEKVIAELKNAHIKMVSCSLYCLDESIHNDISKTKNSLKQVLFNLELLKNSGITVQVKIPLMKKNYDYFEDVILYCRENNFEVKINSCIFPKISGESVDDLNITKEELSDKINLIDQINTSYFGSEPRNKDLFACISPRISLFLDYMGNAHPCINYRKQMGNIFIDSFDKIWNSPVRKEIVNLQYKELTKCVKCEAFDRCVICPGINYMYTKDIRSASSQCCTQALARIMYTKKEKAQNEIIS